MYSAPRTTVFPQHDRAYVVKFDEMVKQVADVLNRSNIAMYAIDAKGVELDTTMDVSGLKGGRQTRHQGCETTSVMNAEQDARDVRRSCSRIAQAVGRFSGNNDIRAAVRRAFDDGRYAYNIAFYPNHGVVGWQISYDQNSVPRGKACGCVTARATTRRRIGPIRKR